MKLPLTIIFIVLGCVAIATVAGAAVLIALHDDPGPLFGFVTPTLVTITGFGALFYQGSKVENKVNGNLTRMLDALFASNAPGTTEVAQQVAKDTGLISALPNGVANAGRTEQ